MDDFAGRDPEPDWVAALRTDPELEPLAKPPNLPVHWVHGTRDAGGLRVDYYIDRGARSLVGVARFGSATAGHVDTVHGGCIATLVDDALGTCAWLAGHYVVSLSLTTEFLAYVPVGSWIRLRARVASVEGRKVVAECEIESLDADAMPTAHARGRGLFLQVSPALR